MNRLKPWYENQLLDQQQGFRSSRGTTDAIFILKRIHQITDKMKAPTFLLFIDLAAAFDHVDRKLMFQTIRKRLHPRSDTKLIELLETLYKHTTTALAQTPEDEFEITNGVRQGGPESSILFNLFIDFAMRVFLDECKKKNIKFLQLNYKIPATATNSTSRSMVGRQVIDWIGYADDLVLVFEDLKNMKLGISLLYATLQKHNLNINKLKTKSMILNHQYTKEEYPSKLVHLNNFEIENVKTFNYLGCIIKYDEPTTGNAEIELRIDTAFCKFYELGKNLMNHRIGLQTRVNIMNALVRSRLTYSCQTWCLTKKQLDHINAKYLSILRRMVKGGYRRKPESYSFALSNADILKKCNTEDIHQYSARIQRNFIAHIIRREDVRITKRLLFNNDMQRRPGQLITLYKTVLQNENMTCDEFNENAILRRF